MSSTPATSTTQSTNPANMLGLDYRAEAGKLPFPGQGGAICDAHVHLNGPPDGVIRQFFEAADCFGIGRVWSQTTLEDVDALKAAYGNRIEFVAVPAYGKRDQPETFSTDWLKRIEAFAAKGVRIVKFWAAPRGRDWSPLLALDHPIRLQGMRLARSLGMMFMTHVGDPDTWFATHYKDSAKYGTKLEHYQPLERLLDEFADVPWLGAHMAGDPEHLDHVQGLLDRHPNYYIDTSATKWMVRELSKQPDQFRAFCRRNPGRVLFGTDIVVGPRDDPSTAFDLYASRYWALRTLLETDYDGPSSIVDPDLNLVDSAVPKDATARLRGAKLDPQLLPMIYRQAAEGLKARAAVLPAKAPAAAAS